MKTLYAHPDGRLKTGRISLVMFILVLIAFTLMFKLQKPLDNVQLKVNHIFEEQQEQKASPPKDNSPEVKPEETNTKSLPQETPPAENKRQAEPQRNGEDDSKVYLASERKEVHLSTQKEITAAHKQPQRSNDKEEEKDNYKKQPTAKKQTKQNIERRVTNASATKQEHSEVTVDHDKYMQIFKAWQTSGKTKEDTKIALRVQNLRESYNFLQMKPVALINGDFIDLQDGSIFDSSNLDEFSQTVFKIEYPWKTWGEELRSAGIQKDSSPELRYYMYEFIKNAIYSRVNQAYQVAQKRGILDDKILPSDIEVIGKTFVINRQGGGRFGVFIPVSIIVLEDNTSIPVDPAWFSDQQDIQLLIKSGSISR